MTNVFVQGHSGFGDAIHQRAAVRKILARGDELWLATAAPCLYHDFPAERLHLVDNRTPLRTQAKNAARERRKFGDGPPANALCLRATYDGDRVKRQGSVVAAMCQAFGVSSENADFRMPVPRSWIDRAPIPAEPYIVYRPPVARREWGGAGPRNPDVQAYAEIFAAIRGDRKVISIADLVDGEEWIVGGPVRADATYHAGELDLEQLAALVKCAMLVYTTAGMVTVMAQAVEAPCITVFGGYEDATSFSGGASWAPWLPIEPIDPCACWSHYHACDKTIDVPAAIADASLFTEAIEKHASRQAA